MSAGASAASKIFKKGFDLSTQRRMAMAIFGVGKRKVWLDPAKLAIIAKAKTRESIRELISKDVVRVIPTHRGKHFGRVTEQQIAANPVTKRIKAQYAQKSTPTLSTTLNTEAAPAAASS
eukprot:TRINITY_DN14210_c0_g1_i1.p2 TRINITY_DN14210_c0_g1~~TRINITY_DN14210_c0_g1_i1.p2  ORF type:complete len:120 (-),score=37.54 TRINITY_DN14210_c0_g1_i1:48-407(-)